MRLILFLFLSYIKLLLCCDGKKSNLRGGGVHDKQKIIDIHIYYKFERIYDETTIRDISAIPSAVPSSAPYGPTAEPSAAPSVKPTALPTNDDNSGQNKVDVPKDYDDDKNRL